MFPKTSGFRAGFLALFGVPVQAGIIMVECINQLRARGRPVRDDAIEGAMRRLRPMMMTMLVATLAGGCTATGPECHRMWMTATGAHAASCF